MVLQELFSQLSLWKGIFFNRAPFASILSYILIYGSGSILGIRIRIRNAPEYGSNTDPDPQICVEPS